MKQSLAWIQERVQTSIWPIPLVVCALMFALAVVMLWLERNMAAGLEGLDSMVLSVASARQLLAVVASSVLSVGGVAFSVTMVALTLTSGQYGPKILRQFLGDTSSKLSLGLYMGTCVYALVTFSSYVESDRPHLTVIVALLLTVLALAAFIQFIHRTATDLQADQIIERIGGQLRALFESWLIGDEEVSQMPGDTQGWRKSARGKIVHTVTASSPGYLQSVDYEGLAQWCARHDRVALVRVRAGDFLLQDVATCKIFGDDPSVPGDSSEEPGNFFLTGPIRTPVQDPEYPVTQLNQLAARALSPGINDPGTAITCIDWFCMGIACIIDRELPGPVVFDGEGQPRLLVRSYDFAGILKSFYAPFRQFSRGNIPVTVSLLESLVRLAELTSRRDRLRTLGRHGELLWSQVEELGLSADDVKDVRQRYTRLMKMTGCGLFASRA